MKPREWWMLLDTSYYRKIYFETFVSATDPKILLENDDYMDLRSRECIHVIEKSAYDTLLAQANLRVMSLANCITCRCETYCEENKKYHPLLECLPCRELRAWNKFKEQK